MPTQTQLIGGVPYEMYSPQWRSAMAEQPASSPAIKSLLSPIQQVDQSNTEAARKQAADQSAAALKAQQETDARNAGLVASGQQNTVNMSAADRQAATDLAAKNAAAHSGDITLESTLADKNAAAASVRSQAAREAMLGKIPGLMSSLTGDAGSGGAAGNATAPTAGGVDPAQSARDTAFARAKDKIGEVQRGAMTALREGMSSRGISSGSGIEAGAMSSLIGEGQGQLSDVVSGQMTSEAQRANAVADAQRAAELTRRGQNLNLGQSMLSLLGSSAY